VPSNKYKDARDLERFSCHVSGLTYFFKAPHANEAKLWVRLINLWREYLLLKYADTSSKRVFAVQKIIDGRAAAAKEKEAAAAAATSTAETAPLTTTDASDATSITNVDVDVEAGRALPLPDQEAAAVVAATTSTEGRVGRLKMAPRQSQALPMSLLQATGVAEVELGLLSAEKKQRKKRASVEVKGGAASSPPVQPQN